ncbi:MAG: tyrosine-type recombinase/integrase [Gemmatimonadaceae bacterium]|nr:tyrosine-type recombinase/integrase [Gemmatimonadaceae bacterium]
MPGQQRRDHGPQLIRDQHLHARVLPHSGTEVLKGTLNRVWYAARYAAGLGDVRLHDLRHAFASTMASGGSSLLMIAKALGHKNTATTNRYAHLLDDPVHAAVNMAGVEIAARVAMPTQMESRTAPNAQARSSSPSASTGDRLDLITTLGSRGCAT